MTCGSFCGPGVSGCGEPAGDGGGDVEVVGRWIAGAASIAEVTPAMTTSDVAGAIPGPLHDPCRFGVYTGIEVAVESADAVPPAARLGLEPPRFCGQCGRRMVVQVRPDGWSARCSRHGTVDSADLGRR